MGQSLSALGWPSLCQPCRSISIDKLTDRDGFIHGQINGIIKSANTCPLCKVFYRGMTKYLTYFVNNGDEPAILSYFAGDSHLLLAAGPQSRAKITVLMSTLENDPSFRDFRVQPLLRYVDTASDAAYDKIKSWLATCNRSHDCYKPTYLPSPTAFPARLIDLDYFGARSLDARLWIKPTRHHSYAALSYCWAGSGLRFKTTTATLAQRIERIRFADLPLTFRDAFTICRRLGIRYLWIDSVCIIQDSREDWEQEAAKMSSIYAIATVTIAADWSPDGDGGIFNRADKRSPAEAPAYIAVRNTLAQSAEESTLLFQTDYLGLDDTPLSIETGAVQKRGWCYQGRALSPRVLHYTATQLIWECRTHFLCQAHPEWNWRYSTQAPLPGLFWRARTRSRQAEALELWYEKIIPQFSSRAISFQSDKLPAVAGLARIAAGFVGGDYVAGLWVEEMVFSLAWNRAEKASVNDRICPSWSWARMAGGVMWPLRRHVIGTDVPLATIGEARVELAGSDPYGAVRGGVLKLSGRLLGLMTVSGKDDFKNLTELGHSTSLERGLLNDKAEKIGTAIPDDAAFKGKVSCLALWQQSMYKLTHVLLLVPHEAAGSKAEKSDKLKDETSQQQDALVYQRVGVGDIENMDVDAWGNVLEQSITIV